MWPNFLSNCDNFVWNLLLVCLNQTHTKSWFHTKSKSIGPLLMIHISTFNTSILFWIRGRDGQVHTSSQTTIGFLLPYSGMWFLQKKNARHQIINVTILNWPRWVYLTHPSPPQQHNHIGLIWSYSQTTRTCRIGHESW